MGQWYLRTQDETFGPESREQLIEWARVGRIQPGQEISDDNEIWRRVEDVPFLDMRFSIDLGDGNPRGPFNKAAAEALLSSGRLPPTATLVESREPFPEEGATPSPAASGEKTPASAQGEVKIIEKVVPVEKIVEKIVEVPVEKIVEKEVVKEVIKEVPVERIVEKTVVDETRVKELEGLLAAEESRARSLEEKLAAEESRAKGLEESLAAEESRAKGLEESLAAATRAAEESSKAHAGEKSANEKLREQVAALEDELRRLPQTASEIADIQAAVYSIMTGEAEELLAILDADKKEFEEFSRRHQDRADRLAERRRTLLRRAGTNIEEMTKRALVMRPEDPRTARIAKEYEDFRRLAEKRAADSERQVRDLTERLRTSQAETQRAAAGARDVTQLRTDIEELKAKLQVREKELLAEKQANEDLRRQQATRQQVLMTRLAALESPSIGTAQSMSTNQSREARLVKLPSWMRLGK